MQLSFFLLVTCDKVIITIIINGVLAMYLSAAAWYLSASRGDGHTLSSAFRHLPPNSARFSYATEGALFISAQLSTDAVSALRKVGVLIRLWKQPSAQTRT